jgi:predicted ribosome quality control (RQC) complex YloA/Tae2 family protein
MDIEMLKYGRHFRLPSGIKIISTRTGDEYESVKPLIKHDDIVFDTVEYMGSTIILRGTPTHDDIRTAAAITARYSKGCIYENVLVKYTADSVEQYIQVRPVRDEEVVNYLL